MKLALNLTLFFFTLTTYSDASYSLTNYQIKKICTKEKRVSECIKNLQEKRSSLEKGNLIEIPVIKYKR